MICYRNNGINLKKYVPVQELDETNQPFFRAFDAMEKTRDHFFITGKAGTGKSTLLKYFKDHTEGNAIVLAPTGISAINAGGQTIHSLFLFPPRTMLYNDSDINKFPTSSKRARVLKKADTIILDEVSMVRADLLDAMDYSLRLNMGNNKPFGGKQLLLFGDPYQLEPVVSNSPVERGWFRDFYTSPFFFHSKAYRNSEFHSIELTRIYRQTEDEFIEILNSIRNGSAGNRELNRLNSRFTEELYMDEDDMVVTLCTLNHRASTINQYRMDMLPGKEVKYEARITGEFETSQYPTDRLLKLKPGAQIIFTRNDLSGRWVNGLPGRIIECEEETILVETRDGNEYIVEYEIWENNEYMYDTSTSSIQTNVKGTFTQLPVKPAWAITIHKSQGLTFDRCNIDLGDGAFAHGQLYVALSRCRSLSGLSLTTPVRHQDMIVNPHIIQFMEKSSLYL